MIIETERLILRPFKITDTNDIHPLFCDEEAMGFVDLPVLSKTVETEQRIIQWCQIESRFAIELKQEQKVIGYIAINPDSEEEREDTRELGFALTQDYRLKGYMKETIIAILELLKQEKIRYVWACCFCENTASECLIRSLGFSLQQKGIYESDDGTIHDSLEFRITLV